MIKQIGDYKPGDEIYVGSSWYLSHGADDFCGGLAKISEIYTDRWGIWCIFEEREGHPYNFEILLREQKNLEKAYEGKRAHKCPDLHPDTIRWD